MLILEGFQAIVVFAWAAVLVWTEKNGQKMFQNLV
jgi:hypothetical protein